MDMNNDEKLKKIDEIVSRTYVSYDTAKKALEDAEGDVLEAVILIETKNKGFSSYDAKTKGEQFL
jgi:NACalpha-BTF3-like transcription factor